MCWFRPAGEHDPDGLGCNRRIVAESREPVNARLFAKPSELALGIATRGLLDRFDSGCKRSSPFEVFAQLGVADKLEWFCFPRHSSVN